MKGYTKGERVLRFEGIAHNTKDLRCGRALDKFAPIVTRLKQMVEEFCTANMTSGGSNETPTVKDEATSASGAKSTIALNTATPDGNCAKAALIDADRSTAV